jgi:DNA-binding SARP family transcriptional activator/tetratricopeptide (TPR) repeat protein/DNA-binding XRE family transcriptional regulator
MVNCDSTRSPGGKDQKGAAARLGAMIARRRRAAGLTQQQLADQAAVSVGAVRDLEQGRTAQPRHATADALAVVLGVDVSHAAEAVGWPSGNGQRPGPAHDAEPMVTGLWLGVLGPLTVWRNGIRADPGAGRQRAVLGLLALHPGTTLHRETIIDAVWGYRPPASAIAMVQSYASRLRRLLGGTALASDGSSYRLALTASQLDALEFARLAGLARNAAAAGNPAAACGWFDRALQLWRGEPLADVSALRNYPALTELAQQRVTMILDHAGASAAAGWPERVLPQLRELASHDPLDERVHARLMLTLAACGQQAAALSVFDQLRQRLDEELGVTPGAELADAHLRIVRGQLRARSGAEVTNGTGTPRRRETDRRRNATAKEATTDPATSDRPESPTPPVRAAELPARTAAEAEQAGAGLRQLPAAVAHFTGRAPELAVLTGMLDQVGDGSGTVVISAIGGMAGIGKTALAIHWAHQAAASFADGQLYVNLRGFGPTGPPATPTEALLGFLDALGAKPERIPAALGAQAALYRSMIAGKRLLIVLDNARDENQVRPLLPGSPGCLVIVTSRNQLTGLAAAEGADLLTLDVLTDTDAHALLAARLGNARAHAESTAVAEIASLCARLPLALAITASRAAARPRFSLSALAAELRDARNRLEALDAGDPAVSVKPVFAWSYQQLSPAAARMFRLLGLHPGPDITAPAAASLAGVPVSQAWPALTELARAHLVTEPLPGRYGFHDLLRTYATEQAQTSEPDADRHAAVGRLLDHYLHSAHSAAILIDSARDPINVPSPRPGVRPERLAGHQQALAWMQAEHQVLLAAIILADGAGHDVHAWQIPWTMTDFLQRQGHWDQKATIERTAVAAATRLGDPAGQAVSLRLLTLACVNLGDYDQALAHCAASLKLHLQLGDRVGEAKVRQWLAVIAREQGRYADGLSHDQQALRLYQATGYRTGEASVLNNIGWAYVLLGDYQKARVCCQQSLTLTAELGLRHGQGHAWDTFGYAEHHLGNFAAAAACYQRALSTFREDGDLPAEAGTLTRLGDTHHAAGELRQAQDAWQQALDILDQLHHPDADAVRAKLGRASS